MFLQTRSWICRVFKPLTCHPARCTTTPALSPGPSVGLWCCCSVEEERWGGGYEVGGCGAAAWDWALLRPHCLCWMWRAGGAGGAWAEVPMRAVFWLKPSLKSRRTSGSGSSDTPGRSSRGRSCGRAASPGWGPAEGAWCSLREDHLGFVAGRGLNPEVLFLPLRPPHLQRPLSADPPRCRACRCSGASPEPDAGGEGRPELYGRGDEGRPSC